MMKNSKLSFLAALSINLVPANVWAVSPSPLRVYGWPAPTVNAAAPTPALVDDPIIGRLACPPLTRLNLKAQKSQPFLLEQASEVAASGKKSTWKLVMPPGVKWWSGAAVKPEDVKLFLQTNLADIVKRKSLNGWDVPKFAVRTEKNLERSVFVDWQTRPKFGIYVLNGETLWRAQENTGIAFECVGPYSLQATAAGLVLEAAAPGAEFKTIVVSSAEKAADQDGSWLNFRFAQEFAATKIGAQTAVQCDRSLDLPVLSAIAWNLSGPYTKDPRFRRTLTYMTPRGELLRAGAGSLGNLVSGPLLRAHPGYDRSVLVREFNLDKAQTELDKLGYRRQKPNAPRVDSSGEILKLRLKAPKADLGIAAKIIQDAFAATGIQLTVEQSDEPAANFDGVLTAVSLPWPSADFLGDLHSKSDSSGLASGLHDKSLDRALEDYSLALTEAKPDFSQLKQIHRQIFGLEPLTILMQHRACLESGKAYGRALGPIIIRDPDWFYALVSTGK